MTVVIRFLRAVIISECLDVLVSLVLPLMFGICTLQWLQIALWEEMYYNDIMRSLRKPKTRITV